MDQGVLDITIATQARTRGSGRVLLVSNRLPMTASDRKGGARPSNGGLVAGLRRVARRWPVIWIGWDGLGRTDGAPVSETVQPWERDRMVALAMTETEVTRFYRRYCNGLLWPVLHGRIAEVSSEDDDWLTYRAINRRFADAVLRHLRPGDRVWVHDYHLMLLPLMLRERGNVPVAFFLHTPFPDAEVFRTIPQAGALVRGVLAADRIGFHTETYAANFLRAATALGHTVHDGASVRPHSGQTGALAAECVPRVHVHPMGIDVDAFAALSSDPEVLQDVAGIRMRHRRLLLGVDRLDYTKGIPQRLLAFEMLLHKYPRLRGSVSFLQVAVPSRQEIAAYRDLKEVVEALVQRINARFARRGWLPVDYRYGRLDPPSLAALYRAADVMVVTPIRDGLNLVAKEFVATRTDGDGVLVLSRFAGAADELDAALQVDPNKIALLAETFRTALTMRPRERRRRMRALRRAIAGNTVIDWARAFLDRLGVVGPGPGLARRTLSGRSIGPEHAQAAIGAAAAS